MRLNQMVTLHSRENLPASAGCFLGKEGRKNLPIFSFACVYALEHPSKSHRYDNKLAARL